jgi:hypothetical protein
VSAPHLRRCATAHCRLAAALRSRLCPACRDDLADRLRDLPAHYAALDHGRTPGTPLPAAAVAARTAIRGVLASWAYLVVNGRAVPRPARSVAGLAEFLHDHVDWLGAHPAAAEITTEIAELVADVAIIASTTAGELAA